jgi:DMSO reductase family type II enzyme chaperone
VERARVLDDSLSVNASEWRQAMGRSALWEALALGFRRPTSETIARLAVGEAATTLADAAAVLGPPEDHALAPRVRALAIEPTPSLALLEDAYWRLFGHTARGEVPPYETEYGEDSLFGPPREMADIGAFFRAFHLVVRSEAHERPDHIACECEFLLVLARREAVALEVADTEMRDETRRAARVFLRDHLGRWAPGFGARLARVDAGGFYGALGDFCAGVVVAECRRVGVPSGPAFLRVRSAEPGVAPPACGP